MILPIISLIALALSIVAWRLAGRQKRIFKEKIKAQEERLDRYVKAENDTKPSFFVSYTTDGRIGVFRYSCIDGCIYRTVIKVFTDPDEDFNRREAEELVEKLN